MKKLEWKPVRNTLIANSEPCNFEIIKKERCKKRYYYCYATFNRSRNALRKKDTLNEAKQACEKWLTERTRENE